MLSLGWLTLGQLSGAVGTLTQNGGAIALTNAFPDAYIGYGAGATGTYTMHGGTLTGRNLRNDYGTGTIYQDGGVISLSGAVLLGTNTGSIGTYTLAGGLLQTPSIAQGSGSAFLNLSGGTLQNAPAGNLSVTMPATLSGQSTVAVDGGQTATFNPVAAISGSGGLTKTGSGTMIVQSNNSYAGPTVISGGVLQLGSVVPQLAYNFSSGSAVNTGNNASAVTSTLVGSPVISATGGPNAGLGVMSLNGSNYLTITASSLPNLSGTANYTIGMWINTTEAGASVLYKGTSGAWSSGDENFYLTTTTPNSNAGTTGTNMGGVQWGGGWVGGNTAVNTGTWEFVSIVRSGNSSTVYVNGNPDGVTTNGMGNPEQGTQFIALGYNSGVAHDGALMYSGSISGSYVYNTALTQAQIQSLMNAGPAGIYGSLPSATAVSLTARGAGLDVNGSTQTIASLNGVGGSSVYLGNGVLTVGDSTDAVFAGTISDSGGASAGVGGSLILDDVDGLGSLELSGTNTYSGGTTVEDGTLVLGNNEAILPGSSLIVGDPSELSGLLVAGRGEVASGAPSRRCPSRELWPS